jgi:hypothetical protein
MLRTLAQLKPEPLLTQNGVVPPQVRPHWPQFGDCERSVSQPSLELPLQLPQFASQTGAQLNAPGEPVQLVVPCEFVQPAPQALQCVMLPSVVSQPFALCPSQLPKPASQAPMVHVPFGHDSAAFVNEHGVPQVLQLVTVSVAVSQPSSGFPLQSLKFAAQVGAQSNEPGAPEQAVAPCAFMQVLPQAEQFAVVPSVVSQPAAAVQSAKPASQAPIVHPVASGHVALACGNVHAWPQFTQFATVVTSVSQPSSGLPLQLFQPASQVGKQSGEPDMLEHVLPPWAFVQALPQAPQFDAVPSCVSQPAAAVQSAKPASQAPIVQPVASGQVAPACRNEHATPQFTQLVVLVTSVSQPLSPMPSQLFQPASHVGRHPEVALHVGVAWKFEHTSLQERQ